MKTKLYFLVDNNEVVGGPFCTYRKAVEYIDELPTSLRLAVKIMRSKEEIELEYPSGV